MAMLRLAILLLLLVPTATAASSTGTWSGTYTPQGGGPQDLFLVLQETAGRVSGTAGSTREDQLPIRYGTAQNGNLSLEIAGPAGATVVLNLQQSGEVMT